MRRYGVDAAILFSDIVVPLHAIGFGVESCRAGGPWSPSRSARDADLERLRPLEPEADAPMWPRPSRLVARELAVGGAAHRVRRRALHRGQLPGRGRAVAHLRQGEGADARRPDLWAALTDRLADLAVASLRAQVAAGAQAVQLFDSWAGSLSPDEYARFALPATRAVLEGIADLGVPTILFGVGTGELLGLMATAGADVVGVDWRVPLDEARRRVGAGCRSRATSTPPCAWRPGPSSSRPTRDVLERAADGTGTGPRLQPRPRGPARADPGILAAVVDLVHAEGRRRT